MSGIHPYSLVRSQRKSLAIFITRDAQVEVRAPMHTPVHVIDRFVASKKAWIDSRLQKRRVTRDEKATFALTYGSLLLLQGHEYPIKPREGTRSGFDGRYFYMPPDLSPDEIKGEAIRLYKALAKQILDPKVAHYAQQLNVVPARVRISSAKTRWGSCSGKKNLNFAWRLIMAEDRVIDYIVVHELAHLLELNHSSRFWAYVEGIIPDYRERNAQLKELEELLSFQDWD